MGTFATPVISSWGSLQAYSHFCHVLLADFNGDSFPDLASSEYRNWHGMVTGSIVVSQNDTIWTSTPLLPLISLTDAQVTERHVGTSPMTFTVSLSTSSNQTVTVSYATANMSASDGADYQAISGTLVFAPGETTKTITVLITGDRRVEDDELFLVTLSHPSHATLGVVNGYGTIRDDEHRISISDVSRAEGKVGQTTLFMFTVTLSAAFDQAVTMSFRTVNGTAKPSDNDYVAKSGTLTFAPGQITKTITIEVKGDNKREDNEVFYLELFNNGGNSKFTKARGVGTIINDDMRRM
jgi:hypothetical protein